MHSLTIYVIIYFGRIIIDIIFYGKKRVLFLKKIKVENKRHRCLMEEKLNTHLWHVQLH